ncbi:hypothetical protein Tco_0937213 [Tanacetum coccineum]|uniref:Uncharacterized protein n=1 Tax=Tanacetum coccineum TaxID=301880 RepID=A0ABQ5DGD7_9ASTR
MFSRLPFFSWLWSTWNAKSSQINSSFTRKTLVNDRSQSSSWLMHVVHIHAGMLMDFSRNSECLVASRVLDDIDDNLKSLFLLWNSRVQSYISSTDLESFLSGNPLFITRPLDELLLDS